MKYINGVSDLYIRKFDRKLEQYNKPMQLPEYFRPMIGDTKSVRIAEVGAGPINTIGNQWPGVEVKIDATDNVALEYDKQLWSKHTSIPLVPILHADMENLNMYPDETFDIVHCVNALDHTPDAKKALLELERICKKGGWVYLRHSSNQKDRFGGHHYWNIDLTDGGKMSFDNSYDADFFVVDGYSISQEYDKEPHDDFKTIITAIWQKV